MFSTAFRRTDPSTLITAALTSFFEPCKQDVFRLLMLRISRLFYSLAENLQLHLKFLLQRVDTGEPSSRTISTSKFKLSSLRFLYLVTSLAAPSRTATRQPKENSSNKKPHNHSSTAEHSNKADREQGTLRGTWRGVGKGSRCLPRALRTVLDYGIHFARWSGASPNASLAMHCGRSIGIRSTQ